VQLANDAFSLQLGNDAVFFPCKKELIFMCIKSHVRSLFISFTAFRMIFNDEGLLFKCIRLHTRPLSHSCSTLTVHLVTDNSEMESRSKMSDANDISSDGNIESMLSVEKGLRELASLKVLLNTCIILCANLYYFQVSTACSAPAHVSSSSGVLIDVHNFLEC